MVMVGTAIIIDMYTIVKGSAAIIIIITNIIAGTNVIDKTATQFKTNLSVKPQIGLLFS
jgi:hypothetical protein